MTIIWIIIFCYSLFVILNKLWCFRSRSKVCLVGKTAIVTGGASGLGYQTALALASKGCRVIIADIVNISQAVEEIIKATHNSNVIGKKLDLGSFKAVREFAKEILATEDRLDILICNAGIAEYTLYVTTEDGLARTAQVNYFSHFLLTHLLLDLLKKSAPSRIIFTSSLLAYVSNLTLDTLNPKPEYYSSLENKCSFGVYNHSKLAMACAAKIFGQKLKGPGVTANAVHPGGVRTSIYSRSIKADINMCILFLTAFVFSYGKNPEQGAQTIIHLAQSDEVENITGESFYEGMRVPRPFQLNNNDFCQKIWDSSIQYVKLEPHEIKC